MTLTCSVRDLSRLVHAKRVRLDPQFRGELVRLFDDKRARMAYFSKHGLTVDQLGEAMWDARLCDVRPTCDEVLGILENLFTPGPVRRKIGKSEVRDELAELHDSLSRELETRRKNRWRLFACACFNSAKIRATKDELPPALAAAICEECGSPWTLQTIKLDLSNRNAPMSAEEVYG